ncbi:MAG TPA: carboxypeptidase-like regulatory domain-containing protein [Longimicrobium sp.]|nr:carboxypeptidase-like regulatory domain-containing protein [Longimicrobium sp.]
MRIELRRTAALLVLALSAAGCGDGGTEPQAGPPASLTIAGDPQTGTVGKPLAQSIAGTVVDAQGKPVPNAVISWVGDGQVFAASTQSGASGQISNQWTLGTVAGGQRMEARWINPQSGASVVLGVFTATGAPDAPAYLAVAHTLSGGAYGYGTSPYIMPPFLVMDQHGNAVPFRLETQSPLAVQGTAEGTAAARTLSVVNEAEWTRFVPDPARPDNWKKVMVPVRVIAAGQVVATADANNEGGPTIRLTYTSVALPHRQPPGGL